MPLITPFVARHAPGPDARSPRMPRRPLPPPPCPPAAASSRSSSAPLRSRCRSRPENAATPDRRQLSIRIYCPAHRLPSSAPDSASAPSAASERWCQSKFCSPATVPCRCWWTPHEDAPSELAAPTLPSRQGVALLRPDHTPHPNSEPHCPDSSPQPYRRGAPRDLLPKDTPIGTPSSARNNTLPAQTKPIKDRPSSCALVHCTVYSIPRRS